MNDRVFIPFPEESGHEYGGADYGESLFRTGVDNSHQAHGHTQASIARFDSFRPCERCGKRVLKGQYIRFHQDYENAVHDGCHDIDCAPTDSSYRIIGKREAPYCSSCFEYHNGECP